MEKNKVSREVTASDINCLENLVVAYNTVFLDWAGKRPENGKLGEEKARKFYYVHKSNCVVVIEQETFFLNVMIILLGVVLNYKGLASTGYLMSSLFIVVIASAARDLFSDFFRTVSPTLLLLVIGGFIVLIAGMGYVGIGKKSSSIMSMYTMLLIFVFALEITAGLGILSFRREIRSTVSSKMMRAINSYTKDPVTANLVDYVQLELKCCGVTSFREWDDILPPRYESICEVGDITLPPSCCTLTNNSVPIVNKRGCLPAVNFMFHRSALSLTTAIIAICSIQILGAYFSYSLASSLSKYKKQEAIRTENSTSMHEFGIPVNYNEKSTYF